MANEDIINEQQPAYLIANSFMPKGYSSFTRYFEAWHSLIEKA